MPKKILASPPGLSAEAVANLESLTKLRDAGVMSQEQFVSCRDRILGSVEAPLPELVRSSRPDGPMPGPSQSRPDGPMPGPSHLRPDVTMPGLSRLSGFGGGGLSPRTSDLDDSYAPRRLKLYERLNCVKEDVVLKVASLAKDNKKPSAVLPKRRSCYRLPSSVVSLTPPLNDNFNRITKVKATNNASITIPIEEYKKMEVTLVGLQEA